ncbi:MAG: M43 family zinc metalloprotease [Chitinophagales bacterium]
MKKIYTLYAMILAITVASAQQASMGCITDHMDRKLTEGNPEAIVSKELLDQFTAQFVATYKKNHPNERGTNYVIPVVFHILHDGGAENLTDALIRTEMSNWNEYYSRSNPELPSASPWYNSSGLNLIADIGIEFRLAHLDPNGHCTTGIEHIYTQGTYYGNDDDKMRPWPREKYLNIWVVRCLQGDCGTYGTLAYAYYPSSVSTFNNGRIIDGIIVKYGSVGGFTLRGTIAHEAGHWMNLQHTWGNNNDPGTVCGDDGVDDTPITKGNLGGCDTARRVCSPGRPDTTKPEAEQDIMNYSDCSVYFTEGQKARMLAVLEDTLNVSGRNTIWKMPNLIATGVDGSNTCEPAPIAEYGANKRYVCLGSPVKFTDYSYNYNSLDSRTWTFPGDADITTSNNASENITFSSPGFKEVQLQVTNTSGSDTKIKSIVYVADNSNPITAPAIETFEDRGLSESRWVPLNYDNNQTSFSYFDKVGHSSRSCYKLNNYDSRYRNDLDELVSPPYDLSYLTDAEFRISFRYSFATFNSNGVNNPDDSLVVYISKDCGATWKSIYSNGRAGLYNAGYIAGPYTPQSAEEYWRKVSVNLKTANGIGAPYKAAGVLFKFAVFSSYLGNNFYLDNINIGNVDETFLGINDHVAIEGLSVYPNPATDKAIVEISTSSPKEVSMKLVDLTGKEIKTVYEGAIDGDQRINFETGDLASGIYHLQVVSGKDRLVRKFVKL